MAYQRVSTPRFYMDIGLFARHHGIATFTNPAYEPFFKLNPTKSKSLTIGSIGFASFVMDLPIGWVNTLQYMAVLGHDFYSTPDFQFQIETRLDGGYDNNWMETSAVNCSPDSPYFTADVNGYSLIRFNNPTAQNNQIVINFAGDAGTVFNIGDVSAGWIFDMSHSPDLSLKLSYQNESIKTQTTKGGHSLTNSGWAEPPYWLNLPQWMTSDNTESISNYKGMTPATRRQYDLSFSFLADTTMLNQYYPGDTASQVGLMTGTMMTDENGDPYFNFTGMQDNFFSKCWMGSANGKLPFIFQPDKDVDEFAICKFNTDTFTLNQVANNVYDVSVSLTEIW